MVVFGFGIGLLKYTTFSVGIFGPWPWCNHHPTTSHGTATRRQMRRKAEEDALARAQAEAAAQAEVRKNGVWHILVGFFFVGRISFWHRTIDLFMFKNRL